MYKKKKGSQVGVWLPGEMKGYFIFLSSFLFDQLIEPLKLIIFVDENHINYKYGAGSYWADSVFK